MPKIIRAAMVDADMLDVQLDNGHILLLDCRKLLQWPGFEPLAQMDRIRSPHTDGDSLFWDSGQRLTVSQIISFIQKE